MDLSNVVWFLVGLFVGVNIGAIVIVRLPPAKAKQVFHGRQEKSPTVFNFTLLPSAELTPSLSSDTIMVVAASKS
jgi:hypothetical protein